jgi:hypothetical protein
MLWLKLIQPWNHKNELIDSFVKVEGAKADKEHQAFKHIGSILNFLGQYPNYDLAFKLA